MYTLKTAPYLKTLRLKILFPTSKTTQKKHPQKSSFLTFKNPTHNAKTMCRMLYAQGIIDPSSLFQAITIMAKDQTMLHEHNHTTGRGTFQHGDGWGLAYQKNNHWTIEKSIHPIYQDTLISPQLNTINTNRLLLHVRKTSGTSICLENTHPFYYNHPILGELLFCHNGTIKNKIDFDQNQFTPIGTTDTEQLFYAILTTAQTIPLPQAIIHTLAKLTNLDATNIILLTKNTTYIAVSPHTLSNYFSMSLGVNKTNKTNTNSIIISSEPITHPKYAQYQWTTIPQNTFITINEDNTYSIQKINLEQPQEIKM